MGDPFKEINDGIDQRWADHIKERDAMLAHLSRAVLLAAFAMFSFALFLLIAS